MLPPHFFLSEEASDKIKSKVDRLLEDFELEQYKNVNPPFSLSLGEKKRLTLISVLAYSPGF